MSYLLNGTNLNQIFDPVKSNELSNTGYEFDNKDFNAIYQTLGTYSNLKYWNSTQYYTNQTDLNNLFQFKLITGTDAGYNTFPITNGVLIYIQQQGNSGTTYNMTFNSTSKFDVTVYVCAGGGGGGGAANSGNAGGGGGGGGLAVFQLNQTTTSFDKITFSIGAGGSYATSNASATAGGTTTCSVWQGNTTLLSCETYGGGYGGNGKGSGGSGGSGGGGGSGSNSGPAGGIGIAPIINVENDNEIGYNLIFKNGVYRGGNGQKEGNDNGGAGGGGGAGGNGGAGGSTSQVSGGGGQGYASSFPGGPTLYLSYGGGGGASYAAQPAPAQPGAGRGGYGTSGSQQGTAASYTFTSSTIYAGSGGGGNGNDGGDSSFGNGSGANGLIALVFTNKYANLNFSSNAGEGGFFEYDLNGSIMVILTKGSYLIMENSNLYNITAYVAAGGGGGGNNANQGNAGGGGGGGGVAVFSLSQSSTNIDKIEYSIGAGGKYATSNASATAGVNTTCDVKQGNTTLLSCTTYGGGYGGNGKGNGGSGSSGGGGGSGSNSGPAGGIGNPPDITVNDEEAIGYNLIFKNGKYSGGQGEKNSNDNGGAGGGGGAEGNGGTGGGQTLVSGKGGLGYNNSEYVSLNGPNIYLSYGGGGGAAYSQQPAPAQPGAGQGGYGTNGKQNGTAASDDVSRSVIYFGSGGGGVGNDGDSSLVTGNGNGAQGGIILVFTPKPT